MNQSEFKLKGLTMTDGKIADELRKVYLRSKQCLELEEQAVIKRIYSYEKYVLDPGHGKLDWNLAGSHDRAILRRAWTRISKPLSTIRRNSLGHIL